MLGKRPTQGQCRLVRPGGWRDLAEEEGWRARRWIRLKKLWTPNRGRQVVPKILASGTVGEPETTVPASPQDLIAVGIADVDAPPTIVDALEEDLAKNTGEIEVVESSTREANVFGLHGRLPRDVDDCSSAGSESCWGEMEDIGDDEIPEWGVLPPPQIPTCLPHWLTVWRKILQFHQPNWTECILRRLKAAQSRNRFQQHPRCQQIHHCPHGLMGASVAGVQFQVADSPHCPTHLIVTVNMLWLSGPVQTPMQVGGWLFLPVHQAVGRGCEWLVIFNEHHKPPPFQHLPESLRDMEFDMTRGDSRGDTESVEHNADEGHHPLNDGSDSDMEAWWGASQASGDDEFVESTDDEPEIVEARPTSAEVRGALRFLDEVNLQHEFAHRGCVMKNIPKFLRGPFRSALRLALR